MSDGLYEILALAARYFFAGLFLLIVLRAWRVTVRDARSARKLRRLSPQTGLSGELVVLEGDGRARRGMRYPVILEGTLGRARSADIRVRHPSVRPHHARFELTEDGLSLAAVAGAKLLDGDGKRAQELLLRDGDCFTVGAVLFTLVLIDATGRAGDYAGQEDGLFDAPAPRCDGPWEEGGTATCPRFDGHREIGGNAARPGFDGFWQVGEGASPSRNAGPAARPRPQRPASRDGRARPGTVRPTSHDAAASPRGKNTRPHPWHDAEGLFLDIDDDEDNF